MPYNENQTTLIHAYKENQSALIHSLRDKLEQKMQDQRLLTDKVLVELAKNANQMALAVVDIRESTRELTDAQKQTMLRTDRLETVTEQIQLTLDMVAKKVSSLTNNVADLATSADRTLVEPQVKRSAGKQPRGKRPVLTEDTLRARKSALKARKSALKDERRKLSRYKSKRKRDSSGASSVAANENERSLNNVHTTKKRRKQRVKLVDGIEYRTRRRDGKYRCYGITRKLVQCRKNAPAKHEYCVQHRPAKRVINTPPKKRKEKEGQRGNEVTRTMNS
jgi:hypothetical protein